MREAVLAVAAPRLVVARVPVRHEDPARLAVPEHRRGDRASARLPEPVERDVLREEPVRVLLVRPVARPVGLVGVLHVGPEILPAQPRHARLEDVGDQRVLLEQRARVHARAAGNRADGHAVQVAVGHVLRERAVRRGEARQDAGHLPRDRLAAVRAEPAPDRPVVL